MLMQTSPLIVEFEQAYQWVMQQAYAMAIRVESVPLWQAQGVVLAEDISAPINLPAWAQSAMDGYAINSQDSNALLKILPTAFASRSAIQTKIQAGQAQRIMTGALIPQGCDAVLPIEYAVLKSSDQGEQLLNPNLPKISWKSGKHIKAVGSDVQHGEIVLKKGQKLGAKQIALLASLGIAKVAAYVKPRVALLTLGDELIEPGQPLAQGAVYNANQYLLRGLLSTLPIDLVVVESLADEPAVIENRLLELSERVDCILTVGGSSVGDKDWLPKILKNAQNYRRFKINMKPAKPLLTAMVGKARLLGLPGNPVAAYFSFQLFAEPFLQMMARNREVRDFSKGESVVLAQNLTSGAQLQWLSVKRDGNQVSPLQGSVSQLSRLQQSNGFIRLEPNQSLQVGEQVHFFADLQC